MGIAFIYKISSPPVSGVHGVSYKATPYFQVFAQAMVNTNFIGMVFKAVHIMFRQMANGNFKRLPGRFFGKVNHMAQLMPNNANAAILWQTVKSDGH